MRIGLLTASLPGESPAGVPERAETTGFEALELATWPPGSEGVSHLDVTQLTAEDTERMRSEFTSRALALSGPAY